MLLLALISSPSLQENSVLSDLSSLPDDADVGEPDDVLHVFSDRDLVYPSSVSGSSSLGTEIIVINDDSNDDSFVFGSLPACEGDDYLMQVSDLDPRDFSLSFDSSFDLGSSFSTIL